MTNSHQPMTCADNARRGSLARLLATENLHVEHATDAQTASFDLNSRTLTLPVWDRANPHTYDMLVGHEVGHALFTPNAENGWCEAASTIGGEAGRRTAQTYLNVVEDARIERLIQSRYPGLRKDFFHGYRDIWQQGFFGISDVRGVASAALPDRLNMHFKVGSFITVPFFNDAEREFVKRIGAALTWQEVVDIAGDLFTYMKSPLPPDQPQDGEDEDESDDEFDFEDQSDDGESEDGEESESGETFVNADDDGESAERPQGEEGKAKPQGSDADADADADADSEKENSRPAKRNGTTKETSGVPEAAATDDALQRHLDRLSDGPTSRGRVIHAYLPKPNITNIVRDYKRVLSDIGYIAEKENKGYDDWNAENRKTVELMAKSFDLKKAAEATARTSIRRTGVLDTGSLHKYRYTEDIFRKTSFTRDGKNHGMILILDWSGSMSGQMLDTVKQLVTLVGFCRRVSIPFEVYAFSDRHELITRNLSDNGIGTNADEDDFAIFKRQWTAVAGKTTVSVSPVCLMNLFSSRMNRAETDRIAKSLYSMFDGSLYYGSSPRGYSLGGTPMNAALLAVREIAKSFRKASRVEILNTIVLTDGDASDSVNHPHFEDAKDRAEKMRWVNGCGPTVTIHDGESGRQWFGDSWAAQTANIVNCLRADAGTKVIQMMIGYAKASMAYYGEAAVKTWAEEGFAETTKATNHGWDAAFVIKSSAKEVTMEELLAKRTAAPDKTVTTANIKNAFIKQMKSRTSSRVLVNRLTDLIA